MNTPTPFMADLDAAQDEADAQCKYCLRHAGLHLPDSDETKYDTALVDPAWDGDGDVCFDCFEERAAAEECDYCGEEHPPTPPGRFPLEGCPPKDGDR